MQIIILLDGREFVSEPVQPEPSSIRAFAVEFNARLPSLLSFQMVLMDGSAIILSQQALQRAVFLFRESAPIPSALTLRIN